MLSNCAETQRFVDNLWFVRGHVSQTHGNAVVECFSGADTLSLVQDMPREYAEIIKSSWTTDMNSRPEFYEMLPTLKDMHQSLNPNNKISSKHSSSSSILSANSTASNVSAKSASSAKPQQPRSQPTRGVHGEASNTNSRQYANSYGQF